MKIAANASRNGTGVHEAEVDTILLNIAGKSFHVRKPERALQILRNQGGKGKGERGKGKREWGILTLSP
jgi:hypothetical protein